MIPHSRAVALRRDHIALRAARSMRRLAALIGAHVYSSHRQRASMNPMLIAIFPLQLALFPGEAIPLHIFEPRYRQLIAECRDEGIHFGIPTVAQGNLSAYGAEVELFKILKTYDNGEMDVLVRGLRVFHIVELRHEVPGKLYSGATVEFPEDDPAYDDETRTKLLDKFAEIFRLIGEKQPDISDIEFGLAFRIARDAGLNLAQRIELLAMRSERLRQEFLLAHIEKAIKALRDQRGSKTFASGNGKASGNGHAAS